MRRLVLAVAAILAVMACARMDVAVPPAAFRPACGHPGTTVVVTAVPVTIGRASCDLTGVTIRYGYASVEVPASGSEVAIVDTLVYTQVPTRLMVSVDGHTGDVTITSPANLTRK